LTTVSPMILDAGTTPYLATELLLVSFMAYSSLIDWLIGSNPTAAAVFASHGIIAADRLPLLL